jgi:hypothetical protein
MPDSSSRPRQAAQPAGSGHLGVSSVCPAPASCSINIITFIESQNESHDKKTKKTTCCFSKRYFLFVFYGTLFITDLSAAPSDSTVSEDAGIESRTVATSALAVSRSNH